MRRTCFKGCIDAVLSRFVPPNALFIDGQECFDAFFQEVIYFFFLLGSVVRGCFGALLRVREQR
ncbi:hypothetical protein AXF13_08205 [Desulfovibrio fairfieldensis]|uniref:Uncharacterized protein n=1 Tax=Desulfovibrio fairfieldensis TaxID=44742 RepID=A0A0X8JJU7_9BACT|nr:hypothetical protein AXF13_08205 [Desulfovibrio fairfieldensis]